MIRVCSGFSPSGRLQYGNRFLKTFDKHWPASVELQVWVEEPLPMPRDACRDLWAIPGAREFHERHRDNVAAHGRTQQPCWKDKERRLGYSFRSDAYKFWKQILIPQAAAEGLVDGDILVWIDADVETVRAVPEGFVEEQLGDADVCYLGRSQGHSEIGFWAIRIGQRTRRFLADIAESYTSDQVFLMREWHSAFVWDVVRTRSGLKEKNLVPPGLRGHVWPHTKLAQYTRHDKGWRKPR